MRLELAHFPVKNLKFSKRTTYSNGVLEVNKDEMVALVLENKKVVAADVDVTFPGEQTRIVNVRDAVEPRVKVSGPGCMFPGIMGPVETVGEGRTHRLSGIAVIPSAQYQPTLTTGTGAQVSGLFADYPYPGVVYSGDQYGHALSDRVVCASAQPCFRNR